MTPHSRTTPPDNRPAIQGGFSFDVERGVHVAPWMGPNGELVLVAVSRHHRRIAERMIPMGDGHVFAADALWDVLEREDPLPNLHVI